MSDPPKTTKTNWHRLFGTEVDLSLRQQFLDVVVITPAAQKSQREKLWIPPLERTE